MSEALAARVRELEERTEFLSDFGLAVRSLVMAHIDAMNSLHPGTAQATAAGADMHRRAAIDIGQYGWAEGIGSLLDELRDRYTLPAND